MLPNAPAWLAVLFIVTAAVTAWIFIRANYPRSTVIWSMAAWVLLQSVLGYSGFYTHTSGMPPRFLFLLAPPVVLIIAVFASPKGRQFIAAFDLRLLTLLQTVRFPVEIVLYGLFMQSAIPELMTFAGSNPDIIMGITAPIVYWLCFVLWANSPERSRRFLIFWNLAGVMLVSNIVVRAVLAVPTVFQQWGFEQPNIAVTYFPYVLLPALVVPLVYFSHLASLYRLIKR